MTFRRKVIPVRFIRSLRGATAVEFALVAPIFLIMVLGCIDVSRALWIKATMQHAVEQTARYAVVNTGASTSDLETFATAEIAAAGFSDAGVTFTASTDTTGGVQFVTVSASYPFSVGVGLIPLSDMTLLAMSRVPLE
ncbi:MAG: pilus assembly protein [Rhodospirillales bacterium]